LNSATQCSATRITQAATTTPLNTCAVGRQATPPIKRHWSGQTSDHTTRPETHQNLIHINKEHTQSSNRRPRHTQRIIKTPQDLRQYADTVDFSATRKTTTVLDPKADPQESLNFPPKNSLCKT
jgi:hypothetical protein